jgi:peroxisomal 2,4-dienoyl-CoA reductase
MCYEALKYLKKGGPGKGPSTGGVIINISATLHYTAAWYQIHVSAAKVLGSSIICDEKRIEISRLVLMDWLL